MQSFAAHRSGGRKELPPSCSSVHRGFYAPSSGASCHRAGAPLLLLGLRSTGASWRAALGPLLSWSHRPTFGSGSAWTGWQGTGERVQDARQPCGRVCPWCFLGAPRPGWLRQGQQAATSVNRAVVFNGEPGHPGALPRGSKGAARYGETSRDVQAQARSCPAPLQGGGAGTSSLKRAHPKGYGGLESEPTVTRGGLDGRGPCMGWVGSWGAGQGCGAA